MCTDYTDLSNACPKDPFPLPCIDKLVENLAVYKYLSFLDAYFGYNQIPMAPEDQDKTAFMIDLGVFCYNVMSFGLKNAGATYQRMMDKVFAEMRGREIEVYIDDMIVKTKDSEDPSKDLESVFQRLRQFNLRLNPLKCTFGMEAGKFLGFMLTSCGIEANLDKCRAILDMTSPKTVKDVQQLTGRIAGLSHFLPASAKRCLPMFKALKKQDSFEWTQECEDAFQELKVSLASPTVLTKPMGVTP